MAQAKLRPYITPYISPYISEEEYLASEDLSPVRREYIDGQVFAMAGATDSHGVITLNLGARLLAHLRGSECRAYVNDMRAQVKAIKAYYYPDVIVSCGARDPKAVHTETPVLIIEVISPSTETIDRREKLMNYRKIPSLREYVLIDQNERCVEVYRLNEMSQWIHEILREDGLLELASLPNGTCAITFDDLYEGVIFTE